MIMLTWGSFLWISWYYFFLPNYKVSFYNNLYNLFIYKIFTHSAIILWIFSQFVFYPLDLICLYIYTRIFVIFSIVLALKAKKSPLESW